MSIQWTVVKHAQVAKALADRISQLLTGQPNARLLLPTGRTPSDSYRLLRETPSLFSSAELFQLDEYCGLGPDDQRTYRAYMRRALPAAVRGPDVWAGDLRREMKRFDAAVGVVDLEILGVGRNGHIAFNEPGSPVDSLTRRVSLHQLTRHDAAREFAPDPVPGHAVTVGVGTILRARWILVVASGLAKRPALTALHGSGRGGHWPVAYLRRHPQLEVLCDQFAASEVRRADL